MIPQLMEATSKKVGGMLRRRTAGAAERRAVVAADEWAVSSALSQLRYEVTAGKFEIRKWADHGSKQLRQALAKPGHVNSNPHGMTNGINININNIKEQIERLYRAGGQGEAWVRANRELLGRMERVQRRTNGLQMRYGSAGGKNPHTSTVDLPYEARARLIKAKNPTTPTVEEFERNARGAIALFDRLVAAIA